MTQSYKTILVAVDGSKGELALHKAIHVALRNQARLIIAHVIDTRALHNVVAFDASVYESLERGGAPPRRIQTRSSQRRSDRCTDSH